MNLPIKVYVSKRIRIPYSTTIGSMFPQSNKIKRSWKKKGCPNIKVSRNIIRCGFPPYLWLYFFTVTILCTKRGLIFKSVTNWLLWQHNSKKSFIPEWFGQELVMVVHGNGSSINIRNINQRYMIVIFYNRKSRESKSLI